MLKAIKIRLYPNNEQETNINKLLGCSRFVYNNCLNYKINEYDQNKKNVGLAGLSKYFHGELRKNPELEWLKIENSKVLTQSILNLLDAYKRFFNDGYNFPKFKSKHDKQTCRFPLGAISKLNNYSSNKITLVKSLKNIKFRTSDKNKNILDKYKDGIRSATLTKHKSGIYTLSILINTENDLESLNTKLLFSEPKNNIIGIDLGIKDFIVDSNNNKFENIKIVRNNEIKIKKLQRKLCKKQIGSQNRKKCKTKLAKYYEKLNNIKNDYLHRVANQLLNENQVIVMETLNIDGMMKNRKLTKSIQELSLSRFKIILKYKAEWYGRDIVEIDRWFPSSKQCSNCKHKNTKLELKDREWTCSQCNTKHDRDLNAAINIRNEGLKILGLKNKEINKPSVSNSDGLEDSIPIRNGDYKPLEIVLDNRVSLQ